MDPTNAERQARWRKRQKKLVEAAKRATTGSTAAAEELARAKARIAALTRENTALKRELERQRSGPRRHIRD